MSTQTVASGSYNINNAYHIESTILEQAISSLEATATAFGTNVILDDKVRKQYERHIREVTNQIRGEVGAGNINVKEGAEYCN